MEPRRQLYEAEEKTLRVMLAEEEEEKEKERREMERRNQGPRMFIVLESLNTGFKKNLSLLFQAFSSHILRHCISLSLRPWGGGGWVGVNSHMEQTGMFVNSLRGVNFGRLLSLRLFCAKCQFPGLVLMS